jgi:hypothetical protein
MGIRPHKGSPSIVYGIRRVDLDADKGQARKPTRGQLQQLCYARVLLFHRIGYLPMEREEAMLFFRQLCQR